jgi:hypothetical protein
LQTFLSIGCVFVCPGSGVAYNKKVATPNGAATSNDFHLLPGSPAIGKGNSTYNSDIGAYTSDGQGNKH